MRTRRHPFYCWQDVTYLGRVSNTAFAHAEPTPLVVGQSYLVRRCGFARDINGDRQPVVYLVDVPQVLLENGNRSGAYSAANFRRAEGTEAPQVERPAQG